MFYSFSDFDQIEDFKTKLLKKIQDDVLNGGHLIEDAETREQEIQISTASNEPSHEHRLINDLFDDTLNFLL
jgi:hypothetical protein